MYSKTFENTQCCGNSHTFFPNRLLSSRAKKGGENYSKCRNLLCNLCFLPLPPPFATESYLAQIAGKPATAPAQMQPLIAKWHHDQADDDKRKTVGLVLPIAACAGDEAGVQPGALPVPRSLQLQNPNGRGAAAPRPWVGVLRGFGCSSCSRVVPARSLQLRAGSQPAAGVCCWVSP